MLTMVDAIFRVDNHAACGTSGRMKILPHPNPLPEGEGIYRVVNGETDYPKLLK